MFKKKYSNSFRNISTLTSVKRYCKIYKHLE